MHSSLSVFSVEAEELPFNAHSTNGPFSSVPSKQQQPHNAPVPWQGMSGRAVWPPQALSTAVSGTTALVTEQALQGCCLCTHKTLTEKLLSLWFVVLEPHLLISMSSSFTFPNLPHLSHLNVFFWTVSAPAVDTFGFPSLIHQHQSFLHVLYSPLLFFGGSACWAEREERILCYQSSEKGRGANWWWCGMYHGGKEGPRSCLGKSISHTSLLHLSDKGKKNSNGDSNKTDWAFYWMLMPAVKWQ